MAVNQYTKTELEKQVARKVHKKSQQVELFDLPPDWKSYWWGMPRFENGDLHPQYTMTVSFMTKDDKLAFGKKLGIKINEATPGIWFPTQQRLKPGEYRYTGPKTDSRYPICIPSKGRADCQTTGKCLDKMGVNYRFFVEDNEYKKYCEHVGSEHVVKMPFHDLGKGSIPARNYIWEWAKEKKCKRHWTVDDNIQNWYRANHTRRLMVEGGGFFHAMEDFVDRYQNVAMAGPHHIGFCAVGHSKIDPVLWNSRVYSCILLDTSLPHRWRGRYNEDTDLSIRLLKDGYCTLLFHALMMKKGDTAGSKGHAMKGGNTDNVYNGGDHRLAFAQSLADQHPDVVKVVWRFNRWHHLVNYAPFARNTPVLKEGVTPVVLDNEYGMQLIRGEKYDEPEEEVETSAEEDFSDQEGFEE